MKSSICLLGDLPQRYPLLAEWSGSVRDAKLSCLVVRIVFRIGLSRGAEKQPCLARRDTRRGEPELARFLQQLNRSDVEQLSTPQKPCQLRRRFDVTRGGFSAAVFQRRVER
jgi:hypothetical protein